jgi:hypothetical protein
MVAIISSAAASAGFTVPRDRVYLWAGRKLRVGWRERLRFNAFQPVRCRESRPVFIQLLACACSLSRQRFKFTLVSCVYPASAAPRQLAVTSQRDTVQPQPRFDKPRRQAWNWSQWQSSIVVTYYPWTACNFPPLLYLSRPPAQFNSQSQAGFMTRSKQTPRAAAKSSGRGRLAMLTRFEEIAVLAATQRRAS